jgi:recombinational DNA repair protein RecT
MTATQFSQKEAKQAAEQFLKQKTGKVVSIKAAKVVPISKTQSSVVCKAMAVNLGNNDGFAYFVPIGTQNAADQLTIKLNIGTTGISEIYDSAANTLQGPYYNLNGQQVSKPGKGIYIVNGKKVIFK